MKRASNSLALGGILLLVVACGGKFEQSGSAGGSGGSGQSGSSGSAGTAAQAGTGGKAGAGGVSGSAGVGGGTGGAAVGGASGGGGCVQGGACAPEGVGCTEPGCCPCFYECRGASWQVSACAGCVPPMCPATLPQSGESCDECQHPVGTPCDYDFCPMGAFRAVCDSSRWRVDPLPCGTPGCCSGDAECLPGQICVSTVCKTPTPNICWRDSLCAVGSFCSGAFVCPCLADCAFADQAGTCVPNGYGCCRNNASCTTGQQCIAGMCKPLGTMGSCWSDRDCPGAQCNGEQVCACGTACALPDRPGTCSP